MKPLEGSNHSAHEALSDYLSDLLLDNDEPADLAQAQSSQQQQRPPVTPGTDKKADEKEKLVADAQPYSQEKPVVVTTTRQLPEVLLPQSVLTPVREELQKSLATPELTHETRLQKLQKASLVEAIISGAQKAPPVTAVDHGRPGWAESPFECLLFQVAGLKLAVPLVSLGGVYLFNHSVTPLVGQPEWQLGLYKNHDQSLSIVDTAWWVMPEQGARQTDDNYHYIISIEGTLWGIAVHDLANAVRISPDAVKWRTQRTKRPWLAGIVIDEMCALLDIAKLAKLFDSQAKNQRSPKK
ncbi:chemotaxis protein CheW [Spartinivicinus ruber]|uniref:chemotaxis protein CheW n=1 Tax=Spartinivicinus ruber TaxID=2683272 RepID=UPI0013CF50F5|nr:chemotaxis protein CheW [Spartinivicinus ruber]